MSTIMFSTRSDVLCAYFYLFFLFFFLIHSGFTGQEGKGEAIYLTSLYPFHLLHRHIDIDQVIAVESSPLDIAGSQT